MTEQRIVQIIAALEWASKSERTSVTAESNLHADNIRLWVYCADRGEGAAVKTEDGTDFDAIIDDKIHALERKELERLQKKYVSKVGGFEVVS